MENPSFEFFSKPYNTKTSELSLEEYDRHFEAVVKQMKPKTESLNLSIIDEILEDIQNHSGIPIDSKTVFDIHLQEQILSQSELNLKEVKQANSRKKERKKEEIEQAKLNFLQASQKKTQAEEANLKLKAKLSLLFESIKGSVLFIDKLGVSTSKIENRIQVKFNSNSIELEYLEGSRLKPRFEGNWVVYRDLKYIFPPECFSNFIRMIEFS